jgi:hypothetical protein
MLNEQRIEHLRIQIQGSSLLSDHEKADWLNLLELMNDKQLGELEEILTAPAPAPAQASQPKQVTPPMSHIANMPSSIVSDHPIIRPSPSLIKAPAPAAVAPKPAPSLSRPSTPAIPRVLNPQPAPRPAMSIPASSATGASVEPMNPLELPSLEAVQEMSVATIRQHEHSSIINAIQTISQAYGYFATLQNFEASSLYSAYIAAGKNRLSGRPDSTLSQAEFELVTDILQGIRLNRS